MEEKKKRRLPVLIIIIFVIVLAALYAVLYLIPEISGSMTQTSVVRYATIQAQSQCRCIFARSETVFSSGGKGNVSYYVEEGSKTRKGTKVADVYSAKSRRSLTAPSTGIVSFYLDGKEEYFSPENFDGLDADEVAELEDIVPESKKPSSVDSSEDLFKIISSNTWYVIVVADKTQKEVYFPDQTISVEISGQDRISARVERITEGEKNILVFAAVNRYFEDFAKIRTVRANVISSSTEGLLIPTSALATNGENNGVYVIGTDGDYSFRAVDILIEGEDDTLIADGGYVKLYDEVLKNAADYKP